MVISICGEFLKSKNPMGTDRVAMEVVRRIDELENVRNHFELVIPDSIDKPSCIKNLEVISLPDNKTRGFKQIVYGKYVTQNHRVPLVIDSRGLYKTSSYFYIYDINYVDHPENFNGLKRKYTLFQRRIGNYLAIQKARIVFTDSNFQRDRIIEHYKLPPEKVKVTYLGWEHMRQIEPSDSILQRFPNLLEKKYCFSLGSVIKYKNLKWTLNVAKKNPDYNFVLAGKIFQKDIQSIIGDDKPDNVIILGYISDGEMKYAMQHASAFIYPSLYEGFGIPPLEAVSCGVPIIVSTSTCLPEVYQNYAHYIDPYNYDVNIDELLKEGVDTQSELLEIYSWDKTTTELVNYIFEDLGLPKA